MVIGTDEEWQKSADEIVKMIRIAAAKLGMEVDDFIAMALKEHAKEQQPKPVPAFNATSTTFIPLEEVAKAEAEAPVTYFPDRMVS